MRKLAFLLVVFSVSASTPLAAQETLVTGSALIGQLEAAGKTLISQAQSSMSAVELQLGQTLSSLAAQLRTILGDQLAKPVSDLNATVKVEAERALAALVQAQAFMGAIEGCGKQDVESIATTALIGIRQLVSDNVPWSPDFPIIRSVRIHSGNVLFGIRSAPDVLVDIAGENLADPRCAQPTISIDDGTGAPARATVFTSSANLVSAKLDDLMKPGDFRIRLSSYRKRQFWFGCSRQPEVAYPVKVLPKAVFKVNYKLDPVCSRSETKEFYIGGFGRTNSSCDSNADDNQTIQFTSEPGWRSVSARQTVKISNDHCSAIGPSGRGYNLLPDGRSVQIGISCSPRSGRICAPFVGCSCSGSGTGYEFDLWVTGQREGERAGSPTKGAMTPIVGFASTVAAGAKLECEQAVRYSLTGNAIYPDGTTQSFPARTDVATNSVIVARPDGFSLEYDPGSAQVTATTPRNTCRGIY